MKQWIINHKIPTMIFFLIIFAIFTIFTIVRRDSSESILPGQKNNQINSEKESSSVSVTDNKGNVVGINHGPNDGQSKGSIYIRYTDQLKNLPSSEISEIQSAFYFTLAKNTSDPLKVTDAEIRKNTIQQDFNKDKYEYVTTFLIDIPSLKQTYQVRDLYSLVPANKPLDYNPLVLCPDNSQLRWGTFDCTDRIRQDKGR